MVRRARALPPVAPPLDEPIQVSENPHLVLGNPSNAGNSNLDNYLIARKQYVLSYNQSRNLLNWASWEVDARWLGQIERQDDFRPEWRVASRDLSGDCRRLQRQRLRTGGMLFLLPTVTALKTTTRPLF